MNVTNFEFITTQSGYEGFCITIDKGVFSTLIESGNRCCEHWDSFAVLKENDSDEMIYVWEHARMIIT